MDGAIPEDPRLDGTDGPDDGEPRPAAGPDGDEIDARDPPPRWRDGGWASDASI